jgi:AbrB family looped-hinge helix DNA binding protein
MAVTETRKGQVTIPKPVRDRLGIDPGSKVDFEVAEDGRAYLRPRTNRRAVRHFVRIAAAYLVTSLMKAGLFEPFEHMVARFLRAEL